MTFKTRMSEEEVQRRISEVKDNDLTWFVGYVGRSGNNLLGLFVCKCGNHHVTQIWAVLKSLSQSCGCRKRGTTKGVKRGARPPKPGIGVRAHPLRTTYEGMIARCYYPGNTSYENYGGRGIQVCERWRNDFFAFVRDMGPKPTLAHSIDRIDPNGHYSPENCRWATALEQARNRRRIGATPKSESINTAPYSKRIARPPVARWGGSKTSEIRRTSPVV